MDTKVAQARKFLEHNDKVQVTVLFRGREMQHQEEGRRVLDSVLEKLADAGQGGAAADDGREEDDRPAHAQQGGGQAQAQAETGGEVDPSQSEVTGEVSVKTFWLLQR